MLIIKKNLIIIKKLKEKIKEARNLIIKKENLEKREDPLFYQKEKIAIEDRIISKETVKEKALILKKEKKSSLKERILEHFLTLIIQNISVKKEQIIRQQKAREKNLILKKARRNSKIEVDQNLLSLKNIEEVGTN